MTGIPRSVLRVLPTIAAAVVILAGCASSTRPASPSHTSATTVSIHGWIVSKVRLNSPSYDDRQARIACSSYMTDNEHTFPQIVIHGPNGDTLAAATVDIATMQYSEMTDDPSYINCGAQWHAPPVARFPAYTVNSGRGERVVNLADADSDVNFRGN
jgi:hypothetical protein